MIRFAISDRKLFPGNEAAQQAAIAAQAARLSASGIDFFQVREKDLSPDELVTLVRHVVTASRNHGSMRVLVSGSIQVALRSGADGVHLISEQLANAQPNALDSATKALMFTASCHNFKEIQMAKALGVSAILFGPVFNKNVRGEEVMPGLGLDALRTAVHHAGRVPVIALGGITEANQQACIDVGAAGIAGIRMFL